MSEENKEWIEIVRIPATHPSLPGHFPGQPVVAGVILLDRVAARLQREGLGSLKRISAVKFRAPLLPEQDAELHIAVSGKALRFRVSRDGALLTTGNGELA
ncbi:MAG TPA: hydroxymyristoyl-ACP dehydratase [Dokdonella sp.]|uniref:hydroxymyristoyl-ACP dehydratase n=1 Tax=Dokdonella sp. TaxID=2291710 RepID=UPI002D7E385C|nr:hydroxymyristoyl-ACP dehydratase [Dokdonella sp.]HET9033278.1 hydroxymyristoyl-ACP dehydratase [Dokdonella sp.]